MMDFTIMEYNFQTRAWKSIGLAQGVDSKEAKKNFIKQHGWDSREDVTLFAKPPVCR